MAPLPINLRSGTEYTFNMANFRQEFLDTLQDPEVAAKLRFIFKGCTDDVEKVIKTTTDKIRQELTATRLTVDEMKKKLDGKNEEIKALKEHNIKLESRVEDLEQYSRRGSMRVFGLSEATSGSTDQKILDLCNNYLSLDPPIEPHEIEVSHRVGKPADEASPPRPRAVLVKFVSRRTKTRVMAVKKQLATLPDEAES